MLEKQKPINFTMNVGTIEEAQARRAKWEKRAAEKGKSLSKWLRDLGDEDAGYKSKGESK